MAYPTVFINSGAFGKDEEIVEIKVNKVIAITLKSRVNRLYYKQRKLLHGKLGREIELRFIN